MIVLSLFNSMNCIGLALHKLGIKFKIYASEIDKYANTVSNSLFPGTINLGDVRLVKKALSFESDADFFDFISKNESDNAELLNLYLLLKDVKFDLVVAGSPCQGFSFAGKQLNFNDERSKLFFEFVDILKMCKKKNSELKFLLENVKMKKEYEAVISRFVGIDPIEINSSLLSAQNRERLYWTNIGTVKQNLFGIDEPGIKQPSDLGILLRDVLDENVDDKYFISDKLISWLESHSKKRNAPFKKLDGNQKSSCLTATAQVKQNLSTDYIKCGAMRGRYKENGIRQDSKGSIKGKSKQEIELRSYDKTNCLTTVGKDNLVIQLNKSKESGGKQPYQHNRVYSIDGKSPNLDTDGRKNILTDLKIRRLTPKECMRLQTIPDWAIDVMLNCGVSDSQLYKMLGNGWTVDVIAYILSHLKL